MTKHARSVLSLVSILVLGLTLGLGACGGDEGDTLSPAQANEAFSSTSAALVSVDTAAEGASQNGDQISASASCAAGGSAAVSGTFTDGQTFNLDVDFAACSQDGITIDGSLAYGAVITENGVAMVMDGTLSYGGKFEATCRFDIRMSVNIDGIEIDGSVCGQEITVSVAGR